MEDSTKVNAEDFYRLLEKIAVALERIADALSEEGPLPDPF